ncbi:MAG: hypothetical protein AAGH72_09120 [Verrucomicrobiota bacterium]
MTTSPILMFIGLAALVIGCGVWVWLAEKKRRAALAELARTLGLSFSAEKDRALARQLNFLDKTRSGSNRYCTNVMRGRYQSHDILAFDYHYETHSTNSKGQRRTHHHWLSFVTLLLPKSFPELTVAPEGFFSKIAQAVGYDDIDFESTEFSRKYVVRSKDRKFAYDFLHARAIEFILQHPLQHLEVEYDRLAIAKTKRFKPENLQPRLEELIEIRNLVPDYLLDQPS